MIKSCAIRSVFLCERTAYGDYVNMLAWLGREVLVPT